MIWIEPANMIASLSVSTFCALRYVAEAICSSRRASFAAPATSVTFANSASTVGFNVASGSVTSGAPAPESTLFHASK